MPAVDHQCVNVKVRVIQLAGLRHGELVQIRSGPWILSPPTKLNRSQPSASIEMRGTMLRILSAIGTRCSRRAYSILRS